MKCLDVGVWFVWQQSPYRTSIGFCDFLIYLRKLRSFSNLCKQKRPALEPWSTNNHVTLSTKFITLDCLKKFSIIMQNPALFKIPSSGFAVSMPSGCCTMFQTDLAQQYQNGRREHTYMYTDLRFCKLFLHILLHYNPQWNNKKT